MTPLIWIINVYWGHYDIGLNLVKLLLDSHANVNIQFICSNSIDSMSRFNIRSGDTALYIAVRDGKIKFISILLECQSNLCIRNQDNDTVFDIAKKHYNISNEIVTLIEKEYRHQIYKYLLCQWIRFQKK